MGGIVVLGAGGRAGRAVTAEARRRGYEVTAVVRDPARYAELGADGVAVVRGDVTDPGSVGSVAVGHLAAVHAVSPFSGPEQGFGALDPDFFVKAADALLGGLTAAGVRRLVAVGLFADLLGADGRPVMDDPAAFPPEIRPFALAHTAGLSRLRAEGDGGRVDWVMLTPGGEDWRRALRAPGAMCSAGSGCPTGRVSCRTRTSPWRWSTRSSGPRRIGRGCRWSTPERTPSRARPWFMARSRE
ncbi:NAD(P)-dependent oxidoreductase [Streptomyces sp. NPDC002817]|uniref:NAD(P)-dependent oxidoreductase n=1 Tax=Streptomyces sp. NPDC088357 TaxID=3154655 RepID=UPI00341B385D